jgi:hypothetical protein
MKTGKVTRMSWLATTALCLALLVSVVTITGCKPGGYLAKNMCNIFDCDTLFFIEDIFPLSARPAGATGSGSSGTGAAAEEEEEPAEEHDH